MLYESKPYKIIRMTKETPDTFIYRVKCGLPHKPGQFFNISVPGIGECPMSVASYGEGFLDFLIRGVGNVTNALIKLKKNDKMFIRGPYGKGYPVQEFKGNDVLIVGGGTGVAPLKGIAEYLIAHRGDFKDVKIFLGFRTYKDMLFKKDIEAWKKYFDVDFTLDCDEKGINCKVGVVTTLIDSSEINNKNRAVFTCGPPVMIQFVIQSLERKGFNHDQIWISLERHMKCSTGKCGHCMINDKYVCTDGPVFRYSEVKGIDE